MKKCTKCKMRKPLPAFSKDRTRKDGHQAKCRACDADYDSARVKTYKQKIAQQVYRHKSFQGPLVRAKALVRGARAFARRQGLEFDLTAEWVASHIERGVCSLSGLRLVLATGGEYRVHPRGPSLDRIRSGEGYTKDNVRVVCWQANMARCQYGDAALLEIAEGIVRTISSQASKEEGSETIPTGSTPKRVEAHRRDGSRLS